MQKKHLKIFRKIICLVVLSTFGLSIVASPTGASAGGLGTPSRITRSVASFLPNLPAVGQAIWLTPVFQPPVLRGMTVHPENPLLFDFIVDRGQDKINNDLLKVESTKLIKYFLASMTIPDKDAWVNLSPYEKDRIIPDALGQTEMGRQMLEQDYILKQLASSLTNPDKELGQKFWKEVKSRAQKQFGTTDIPLNTFNKVWIVPDGATVVEKDGFAYITESKLKVMLDEDYNLSSQVSSKGTAPALQGSSKGTVPAFQVSSKGTVPAFQVSSKGSVPVLQGSSKGTVPAFQGSSKGTVPALQGTVPGDKGTALDVKIEKVGTVPTFTSHDVSKLSTAVFREMILPKLVEEVNTGKNFAQTRQVYQSVILAAWYKKALKDSLLGRIYADKSKVAGVESDVKDIKQKVYDQYLAAFKKGAYNVIKEEANGTDDPIPRKYFSGGENFLNLPVRYVRASSAVNNVLLSVSASSALKDRVIVRAITPESIAEQRTRMKDVKQADRLSAASAAHQEYVNASSTIASASITSSVAKIFDSLSQSAVAIDPQEAKRILKILLIRHLKNHFTDPSPDNNTSVAANAIERKYSRAITNIQPDIQRVLGIKAYIPKLNIQSGKATRYLIEENLLGKLDRAGEEIISQIKKMAENNFVVWQLGMREYFARQDGPGLISGLKDTPTIPRNIVLQMAIVHEQRPYNFESNQERFEQVLSAAGIRVSTGESGFLYKLSPQTVEKVENIRKALSASSAVSGELFDQVASSSLTETEEIDEAIYEAVDEFIRHTLKDKDSILSVNPDVRYFFANLIWNQRTWYQEVRFATGRRGYAMKTKEGATKFFLDNALLLRRFGIFSVPDYANVYEVRDTLINSVEMSVNALAMKVKAIREKHKFKDRVLNIEFRRLALNILISSEYNDKGDFLRFFTELSVQSMDPDAASKIGNIIRLANEKLQSKNPRISALVQSSFERLKATREEENIDLDFVELLQGAYDLILDGSVPTQPEVYLNALDLARAIMAAKDAKKAVGEFTQFEKKFNKQTVQGFNPGSILEAMGQLDATGQALEMSFGKVLARNGLDKEGIISEFNSVLSITHWYVTGEASSASSTVGEVSSDSAGQVIQSQQQQYLAQQPQAQHKARSAPKPTEQIQEEDSKTTEATKIVAFSSLDDSEKERIKHAINDLFTEINHDDIYIVPLDKDPTESTENLERTLEHGHSLVVLDPQTSALRGFLLADKYENNSLWISPIGIKEEFRNQGLAEELIRTLAQKAAEEGMTDLYLSVRTNYPNALALYAKLGFINIGREFRLEAYVAKLHIKDLKAKHASSPEERSAYVSSWQMPNDILSDLRDLQKRISQINKPFLVDLEKTDGEGRKKPPFRLIAHTMNSVAGLLILDSEEGSSPPRFAPNVVGMATYNTTPEAPDFNGVALYVFKRTDGGWKPKFLKFSGSPLQMDIVEEKDLPEGVKEALMPAENKTGGIDFDPSKLNLQIKRDGRGVPLPLPQQNLENINIKGLYPVIINIMPINVQTLPILGQLDAQPPAVLTSS